MRGKLGPVLSGLGGFLLVAGILLNVYAYPRLAVAPIDQNSVTTLFGPEGTVFDIGELEEIRSDLTTTAQTVGDIDASEEAEEETGDRIRIWVNSTSTKSADGVVRARAVERVAHDAHTGEAVNCCGSYSESTQGNPEEVEFAGQVFKFPFGTEQKTYQWWDTTLQRAFPAEFVEEDEIDGLAVYKFVQTIEPTVWTEMEVPESVVGEPGDGAITADRAYGNTRTFWVEPETGVVINREEQQYASLQIDGEDRTTLTEVTTSFTDESVAANVEEYSETSSLLKLVRVTLPLVLGIGGLILVVIGLLLSLRKGNRAKA